MSDMGQDSGAAGPLIGVAAVARGTFDVELAQQRGESAFAMLDSLGMRTVGPRELLFDAAAAQSAVDAVKDQPIDVFLIIQITFTDAAATLAMAQQVQAPICLWGMPEPRTGGRLRLNSLCGLNLAGHALARQDRAYTYLFGLPQEHSLQAALRAVAEGRIEAQLWNTGTVPQVSDSDALAKADAVLARLEQAKIGVVGEHPPGFVTCAYDGHQVQKLLGTQVQPMALNDIFAKAEAVPRETIERRYGEVAETLPNLGDMDGEATRGTLSVYEALKSDSAEQKMAGYAVRCWPEFFNEEGCAACGAMAMMNEDKVPCGCEADVYGTITTLMLQELAGEPAFMADLVDADTEDDTAVFWHCGLAPLSWADPDGQPEATVHSNRRKPLLYEFALKPGRITVARLSQSQGRMRLVIGGGEMVQAPRSFSGTSGVARFDQPLDAVVEIIMKEGLEHHYSLVYGDHREALKAVAQRLDLPVVEIA